MSKSYVRDGDWLRKTLAGVLATAAFASATLPLWYGWGFHFFCGLTSVTAVALLMRVFGWSAFLSYRWVWVLALATFALWTFVVVSNQFHGRPPASDIYLIYGWVSVTLLSLLGLAVEAPRTAA